MRRLPRPTAGDALAVVGVLHTSFGLARYRGVLQGMVRDGLIDSVKGDPEREAAFWFLTCGVSLILTGWLARWTQRRTGTLPPFVGTMLFGISAMGVSFMPRSGFWAVFVAARLALDESDRP